MREHPLPIGISLEGKPQHLAMETNIKKCQNYRLPSREDKRWVYAMLE